MSSKGLIHIYTGGGKGKTTAAVGLSIRAHGAGKKVCFIQFLKPAPSSEIGILKKLKMKTVLYNQKHPLFYKAASMKVLKHQVQKDLVRTEAIIKDKKYDLIVLDEILHLLKGKLITGADIIKLVKKKHTKTELVLTGAKPTKPILALADYVSVINGLKHPYKRGVKARSGIEY